MIGWIIGVIVIVFVGAGIRIVRPTDRAAIETLGKYSKFGKKGFNWIIPIIQRMKKVNITERLADVAPQDIITKDNLNAKVDLVVYFKVKPEEENIKKAIYNVHDFRRQIVSLAQTTARNVIGGMNFTEVNSKRNELNLKLATIIDEQTNIWGIQIVRVEMKEITPPGDVQETMNKVIKASNEKEAAVDYATAEETKADGIKRAKIKEAEGRAKGIKIVAEGKADAIKLVHESADKYFKGNAQVLKKLETMETFKDNSKLIVGDSASGILKLLDVTKDFTDKPKK